MGGGASIADMPSRNLAAETPAVEADREGWLGGGDEDDWFEPDR